MYFPVTLRVWHFSYDTVVLMLLFRFSVGLEHDGSLQQLQHLTFAGAAE